MSRQTRRTFLKRAAASAGVAATFTIAGTKASGKVLGANDTIRLCVAGINGRGRNHLDAFASMDDVQVTHLVDPDSRLFESRAESVRKRDRMLPKCHQDIREALDDKQLDAVSVASTNHWHSLLTVWSCQAGKDVYVEKPCSHNVFEGRKCVEAARKYKCIVQHGTQQRSSGGRAAEMAAIHAGKYGKLLVSKAYCCKPRWSIGFKEPKAPPKELDFNLWLGPAPMQKYHENLVHYNWHWFWDTGNGDMGNQGVHEMDVARWGVKDSTLPKSVWGMGGRWVDGPDFKDQGETPNMELCVYDYGETLVVFETRGLVNKHKDFPFKVANEFYTTEGVIRGGKFQPKTGGKTYDVEIEPVHVTDGGAFGSFIKCVRSRKVEEVNGEIEQAHYSAALCHLGNISYRLGEQVPFSQKPPGTGDNEQIAESFETIKANIQAIGVDLGKATYKLGPVLKFDPEKEKFIGNAAADKLLTREYRKPFVVPENV
ncbi:MAG: Gfo/Idh/MocA family oxidoreductase [Candidatus Nealsonbacteria bacterium]|nr:Gfo/Idh/MocA family oxidoreductase [Candidatus Nealsonbacteria bacterium]